MKKNIYQKVVIMGYNKKQAEQDPVIFSFPPYCVVVGDHDIDKLEVEPREN